MKAKRKSLIAMALAPLLAFTALISSPGAASAASGVNLEVWIADRVSPAGMVATHAAIAAWEKQTGNTVKVVDNSFFELMNKIPLAIPAGNGPDAFMLTNNYLGQFKSQNLISPVALTSAQTGKFLPKAIGAFTLDKQLMGVPLVADVNALIYNKALLPKVPKTFRDLITISKKMSRKSGQHGLLFPIDQFWWSYSFLAGEGSYLFGNSNGVINVKDVGLAKNGAIAAMNYLKSLTGPKGIIPADTTYDVADGLFTSGKAAAVINGPASVAKYLAAGINVGVAPIPPIEGSKNPLPFATYTGFAISKESNHKAETASLLSYLGEVLPAALQTANSGNLSAIAGANSGGDSRLQGWLDQLALSYPLPSVPEMNYVWGPAIAAFTQVLHTKADPRKSLTTATAAIKKAIAAQ